MGLRQSRSAKKAELAVIEGIDAEIADLMEKLKAKQAARAVVVAKVAGIDSE
eukprot:SAG31_NODE_27605_length_423_cov_0.919753_2_plen_51_part_01